MELQQCPILSDLDFEPIGQEMIPTLVRRFREMNLKCCDYSVGGVIIWIEYFDYKMAVYKDTLLLRGVDPATGTLLYYRPIGHLSREEAYTLFRQDASGRKAMFVDFEEKMLDADYDSSSLSNDPYGYRDWDEYLYPIRNFIGFPGKKMSKKRNHLNYFQAHYSFDIEPLRQDNVEEAIALSERLDALHFDDPMFIRENAQCVRMLRQLENTPMFGIAVRVDGQVEGYAFGEVIGDTLFEHVEKADASFHGLYQLLASEIARLGEERGALWINREDDMGSDDLRQSKLSYKPTLMVCKKLYPLDSSF